MSDFPTDDALLRSTEERMRRALGLTGDTPVRSTPHQSTVGGNGSHPQRRQFVRDGDVPVTIIHHQSVGKSTNQLETTRTAMRSLAAAKERAERLLEEAQATIKDLQTKLAHERLAKDEAAQRLESEKNTVERALATVRIELSAEKIGHERAKQALRDAQAAISNLTEKLHAAQCELHTVKVELATERRQTVEAARTPIAAPATDTPANGDEAAGTVPGPRGRPRKQVVVQTVEKRAGAVATTYPPAISDQPVQKVRRPRGRPRKQTIVQTDEKPVKQPKVEPVKWWLGQPQQ